MKISIALIFAITLTAATTTAADSPELTAILKRVDSASKELITHTRTLESTVSAQAAEISALKQQLAAEQAARAQAEAQTAAALADRDAARKAVADAKTALAAIAQTL